MPDTTRPGQAWVRTAAGAVALSLLAACSTGAHRRVPPAPTPTTGAPGTTAPGTTTTVTGSSSSTATTSTVSSASGATGGAIVVEGIVTLKNHPDADIGFEARVNRFNKAGGIDGRQIQFLGTRDDGLDPSQDLSLLQAVVDQDHAVAVAPVATEAMLGPSAAFLAQRRVVAVGLGTSPAFCALGGAPTAPGLSPGGCEIDAAYSSAADLSHIEQATGLPAAQIKLAVIGGDLDADKSVVQAISADATAQGMQVVYQSNAVVTQGATDFAPIVDAIQGAGPNVVYEVADFGGSVALAGVLQATGYRGAVFNQVTYASPSILGQADIATTLNGVYVDSPYPLDENAGDPAVAQIQADLVGIGKPPVVDLDTAIGYWSADLLIQLLRSAAARGADLTPASLAAVADAGWTYTATKGGPAGLTFPRPGWIAPDGCSTLLQLTGTTYKQVAPYACGPVDKVG